MLRVFISSTFQDLKEYRIAARDAVRQLSMYDISMENFGARDDRPKEECIRLIKEETDIFVGIYAYRYGFIPDGDAVSICETEYNAASVRQLPRFIFLLDENQPWSVKQVDTDGKAKKLSDFKSVLRKERITSDFTTPDNLAKSIATALGQHLLKLNNLKTPEQGLFHQPAVDWSPPSKNNFRYKIVAFDFDGTLLKGPEFEFSWEVLWKGLNYAKSIRSELKREYRQHIVLDTSKEARIKAYQNWCEKTVNYFKDRKLTKGKLKELAQGLALTNNCRPALKKLKDEGFTIAIISGGISTFLEEKFPDFRDYVDFVFINELLFNESDGLEAVKSSAFDFQGKADALDVICERVGCSSKETVFVGDHFNDETVMLKVDKAIAYPPQDDIAEDVANVCIREDDLTLILPHILVG